MYSNSSRLVTVYLIRYMTLFPLFPPLPPPPSPSKFAQHHARGKRSSPSTPQKQLRAPRPLGWAPAAGGREGGREGGRKEVGGRQGAKRGRMCTLHYVSMSVGIYLVFKI